MLFNDVIELLSMTTTQNTLGDDVLSEVKKQVYCNRQSIRQSEYYQAMQGGLRPAHMFVIRSSEYSQENLVRYHGEIYDIIRTYDKNGEFMELIAQGQVIPNGHT